MLPWGFHATNSALPLGLHHECVPGRRQPLWWLLSFPRERKVIKQKKMKGKAWGAQGKWAKTWKNNFVCQHYAASLALQNHSYFLELRKTASRGVQNVNDTSFLPLKLHCSPYSCHEITTVLKLVSCPTTKKIKKRCSELRQKLEKKTTTNLGRNLWSWCIFIHTEYWPASTKN